MNSTLTAQNTVVDGNSFLYIFIKNFTLILLGFLINYINGTLVLTFFRNQEFYHDPRYILYIHMVIIDIVQLSVTIIMHVISKALPSINVSLCCFLLLIASFTTMTTPLNLAGMAVERYIAICNPLRHSQICTVQRTYILIALIWSVGVIPGLADVIIVLLLRPLSFFYSSVVCYYNAVYLSSTHKDKNRAAHALYMSFVWLTLMYTYLRVLLTARSASTDPVSARKARNTILLHGAQLMLCMLAYIAPAVDLAVILYYPQYRSHVLFLTYLIAYVLPRLLSPLIYGIRDEKFLKCMKRFWLCFNNRRKVTPEAFIAVK